MFVGENRVQCGAVPGKGCAVSQVHGRKAMRIQDESSGMAYLYLSGQHRLVQSQLIKKSDSISFVLAVIAVPG
jgi:hypothetical protein